MKIQAKRVASTLSAGLILAMSVPFPAVLADDAGAVKPLSDVQLQSEQAAEDKTPPASDEPKKLLNGQVSQDGAGQNMPDANFGASQAIPQVPQMELRNAMKLFNSLIQAGQDNSDGQPNMQDAIRALRTYKMTINGRTVLTGGGVLDLRSQRPKLSSEDIRKIQYGVIGLEAVVQFEGRGPLVAKVYPTCPAALAGIRPGDTLIKGNNYVFQRGDGQRELWRAVGGKADTPVDVTVLRSGEEITFHLVRMNIEDITDDHVRMTYENLISLFGPPDAGSTIINAPGDAVAVPGM